MSVVGVGKWWPTNLFYWMLSSYNSKLSSYNRDHIAHKAKNIYSLALYRKSFTSPCLKGSYSSLNTTLDRVKLKWIPGKKKGKKGGGKRKRRGEVWKKEREKFLKMKEKCVECLLYVGPILYMVCIIYLIFTELSQTSVIISNLLIRKLCDCWKSHTNKINLGSKK